MYGGRGVLDVCWGVRGLRFIVFMGVYVLGVCWGVGGLTFYRFIQGYVLGVCWEVGIAYVLLCLCGCMCWISIGLLCLFLFYRFIGSYVLDICWKYRYFGNSGEKVHVSVILYRSGIGISKIQRRRVIYSVWCKVKWEVWLFSRCAIVMEGGEVRYDGNTGAISLL